MKIVSFFVTIFLFLGLVIPLIAGIALSNNISFEEPNDIDGEKLETIFTATGVIFGTWFIFLGIAPNTVVEKFLYKKNLIPAFLLNFVTFVISTILLFFSILEIIPNLIPLFSIYVSFASNTVFLSMTFYFYFIHE